MVDHKCVLSMQLYDVETQVPFSKHKKKLNLFHTYCLHYILHIKQETKVPETEVFEKAKL